MAEPELVPLILADVIPLVPVLHKEDRLAVVVSGLCGSVLSAETSPSDLLLAMLAVANRLWIMQPLFGFSDRGLILGLQRLERAFHWEQGCTIPYEVSLQDGRRLQWKFADSPEFTGDFDMLSMSANDEQYGQLLGMERLVWRVDRMVDVLRRGAQIRARTRRKGNAKDGGSTEDD